MIHRYRATVIREDEYIIEIDDEQIDREFMKEYKEHIGNIETLEGHAENLAWYRMIHGEDFYEGYGNVLHNGKLYDYLPGVKETGINIKVVSDENVDVLVTKM
ncbi:hypothetical protein [Paenibacillus sp. XY044]|uniref:hypothetical protein n=1 Tax=Paenibacillus sp. XY044 TaxID=2026089 RepID=UPI000B986CEF|nr:hypothetical protein [Paenibacillus sp. XY044]OZB98110.1 hypothetical protein CJP46_02780 [Paenibacillus sp. XY044]